ncbi:MAG TPA: ABC transporter ATP-binding protein [Bryobacteraceae bacterium]|nr:ABC transporter ATP-binding protein [Bryobacteraceae bacterium]
MMLRTDRLAKNFGRVEALESLTVEVPEGSVFALVGPNGAGKSTAMKICLNMLRAVARFLEYCKAFYPAWNDADVTGFVRAYELPLDRSLKSLSRGQRVKAAIAATLAYHPSLLFLDEPFSNLDVLVRDQVIETILAAGTETTVFLASHDLAEIESFATHVAYIDQGVVRFTEEMGTLATRFRSVEVVMSDAGMLPGGLPAGWLNVEQFGPVARFTDSRFSAAEHQAQMRRVFPDAREVNVSAMPLRSIFVALAKSAKKCLFAERTG